MAKSSTLKSLSRITLGAFLVTAGIGHLTFARKGFQAQVPKFVPLKKDDTVVYSGYLEILLGTALILGGKRKKVTGKVAAVFFGAVFPGNIAQYSYHRSALNLDTDNKRFIRLFFQPVLIYWALKSTSDDKPSLIM